jgi:hypothetical protein
MVATHFSNVVVRLREEEVLVFELINEFFKAYEDANEAFLSKIADARRDIGADGST